MKRNLEFAILYPGNVAKFAGFLGFKICRFKTFWKTLWIPNLTSWWGESGWMIQKVFLKSEESRIQDTIFWGKLFRESWIQDTRFKIFKKTFEIPSLKSWWGKFKMAPGGSHVAPWGAIAWPKTHPVSLTRWWVASFSHTYYSIISRFVEIVFKKTFVEITSHVNPW